MHAHFLMFSRYNAWANGRIYDAAATLSPAQLSENRGAAFGSLLGTLNHLLVTDRIWLQRFTGEGQAPDRLDTILFDALAPLREARQAEDRRLTEFVAGLDDARIAGVIRYRRVTSVEEFVQPLDQALAHLFNHQTHHRGQAHAILTGLAGEAPALDLLYFQRLS